MNKRVCPSRHDPRRSRLVVWLKHVILVTSGSHPSLYGQSRSSIAPPRSVALRVYEGTMMQQMLITVRYRVAGDPTHFRHDMGKAAGMIADLPGLAWKIWGFDPDRGAGTSAYLFASEAAARAFLAGPILERLRNRPDVTEVTFDIAPVDRSLSEMTGGAHVLAVRPAAAAL